MFCTFSIHLKLSGGFVPDITIDLGVGGWGGGCLYNCIFFRSGCIAEVSRSVHVFRFNLYFVIHLICISLLKIVIHVENEVV